MNDINIKRKKVFILAGILVILGIISLSAFFIFKEEKAFTFTATIKKISEYNGITLVLTEGKEDINLKGEFDFTIDADTKLLRKNQNLEISGLKAGQKISVTTQGEILEKEPARLTKVTKVIVLED